MSWILAILLVIIICILGLFAVRRHFAIMDNEFRHLLAKQFRDDKEEKDE